MDANYLLQCLAEESSEVALAAVECLHYGFHRVRQRDNMSNGESLVFEINDMYALALMLKQRSILPPSTLDESLIHELHSRSYPEKDFRVSVLTLAERATKVHLACSKSMRFGLDFRVNVKYMANKDFVSFRINQVMAAVRNMQVRSFLPEALIDDVKLEAKASKVEAGYAAYQELAGTQR